MILRLALTDQACNTQYAPLAVLLWLYRHTQRLAPLTEVAVAMQTRTFTPTDKLIQVLISMLAGCTYVSEVNTRLRVETSLARVWPWSRFAEQSELQKTLDRLSLKNLTQLRAAAEAIWRPHSRTLAHDWRRYLCLDLDLSGLPCGEQAEGSTKGYFSGKKTRAGGNWRASTRRIIGRLCGLSSILGTAIALNA